MSDINTYAAIRVRFIASMSTKLRGIHIDDRFSYVMQNFKSSVEAQFPDLFKLLSTAALDELRHECAKEVKYRVKNVKNSISIMQEDIGILEETQKMKLGAASNHARSIEITNKKNEIKRLENFYCPKLNLDYFPFYTTTLVKNGEFAGFKDHTFKADARKIADVWMFSLKSDTQTGIRDPHIAGNGMLLDWNRDVSARSIDNMHKDVETSR